MYLKFFLLKNRGKRSGERRRRTQQYCLDYTMPFFMRKGSRFEKHSIIKKARSNTEHESILLLRASRQVNPCAERKLPAMHPLSGCMPEHPYTGRCRFYAQGFSVA